MLESNCQFGITHNLTPKTFKNSSFRFLFALTSWCPWLLCVEYLQGLVYNLVTAKSYVQTCHALIRTYSSLTLVHLIQLHRMMCLTSLNKLEYLFYQLENFPAHPEYAQHIQQLHTAAVYSNCSICCAKHIQQLLYSNCI